ncbi:MAG: hypothetical protein R2759_11010 [Bacteroidales bacterium]
MFGRLIAKINTDTTSMASNLNATLFYEDALAQWVGAWKQEYIYKANGQLLEFYLAGWDYDNNDWTPPVKQLYEYLLTTASIVFINSVGMN